MASSAADRRLAVLIDAENASYANAKFLFEEIAKYGTANVRRAYGDWTTPALGSWKKVLTEHSIQPVQQFSHAKGKNSSDSALIIDAMDLLYAKNLDGFCIVSSDSDFTRLAARIREDGLTVHGFGEKKTLGPFKKACTTFTHVEVLVSKSAAVNQNPSKKLSSNATLNQKLKVAVEESAGTDGWAPLVSVGTNLRKHLPDFKPNQHGHATLKKLFSAHPQFRVEERSGGEGKAKETHVQPVTPSA